MNYSMRKNGFTLIELVVTIIILGILSVIAVPRFIELQSDARISSLKGLKAEMNGAMSVLYAKSVLQGLESKPKPAPGEDNVIIIDGEDIDLVYGYPAADAANSWSKLIMAKFEDSVFNSERPADWYFNNNPAKPFIRFMPQTKKFSGDNCYLKYTEAQSPTTPPVFEIVDSGC
ncbi:MSHA biogenesis protein MshA [Shewanella sp. Choline-02u-19]|uniref:type II secretion system protein n=2 Tax=unclassified Shewanella TaxID=196818 RepID=UPI000C3235CF|nr:MSHA biogenesis protein MshA [Shewanella sp. GutDb-MelDb]PKG75541.1 MSHA biogenesis protein MshA [Shewanella sp. GutCb]PKH60029.1 MSHA biogenesis protein MshA [Shewanella sp. Bg11-22]PKI30707.1 MSHA biogenesis protein MshA [Shewanella sp. Choline-02u-19]